MAAIYELLKEKRLERKKLAEQTSELIVKASKEKRSMTPAENAEWDARHADIDRLGGEIRQLEKQQELETHLGELPADTRTAGREDVDYRKEPGTPGGPPRTGEHRQEEGKPDQWKTLRKLARYGGDLNCLTLAEKRHFVFPTGDAGGLERQMIDERGGDYSHRNFDMNLSGADVRALGGTSATGDAMIPQGFVYTLNVALKWYGGIIDPNVCTYLDTTLGNLMPYPNVDDTGNAGEITSENSAVTVTTSSTVPADPTFSVVNLSAFMYDSGTVQVPIQLIQDAAFNVEDYLIGSTDVAQPQGQRGLLAIRIGRKLNKDCTIGTGTTMPNGIAVQAAVGVNAAATGAVTYNELVNLEHSVDPSYRMNEYPSGTPRSKFMFNDQTFRDIKKLTDSNSRPLWIAGGVSEGVQGFRPDTFNGYRYVINQDMSNMSSGAVSILFGDFKKYIIRRVRGLETFIFRERYMTNLQLGFLAYQRFDGQYLSAGNPVKALKNSAT